MNQREIRLTEKERELFVASMMKKLDSKGMNIKQLAEELNVSPRSIYNFIGDPDKKPSKFLAAKIYNYLDMKPTDYKNRNSFFILIPFLVMLCIPFKVKANPTQTTTPPIAVEKADVLDEVLGIDYGTNFVPGYYEPIVNEEIPLSPQEQLAIKDICERKNISYPVMLALMEKESRFKTDATNGKNLGICQIHKSFFECDDYFDAVKNVDSATDYIRKLLDEFDGDYEMALQKYNGQQTWKGKKSTYSTSILERSVYYGSLPNVCGCVE